MQVCRCIFNGCLSISRWQILYAVWTDGSPSRLQQIVISRRDRHGRLVDGASRQGCHGVCRMSGACHAATTRRPLPGPRRHVQGDSLVSGGFVGGRLPREVDDEVPSTGLPVRIGFERQLHSGLEVVHITDVVYRTNWRPSCERNERTTDGETSGLILIVHAECYWVTCHPLIALSHTWANLIKSRPKLRAFNLLLMM